MSRQEVGRLQRKLKGEGNGGRSPARRGRENSRSPKRSNKRNDQSQGQKGEGDLEFKRDRDGICRFWNQKSGCRNTPCHKDHVCNQYAGPGKACRLDHRGHNHK